MIRASLRIGRMVLFEVDLFRIEDDDTEEDEDTLRELAGGVGTVVLDTTVDGAGEVRSFGFTGRSTA